MRSFKSALIKIIAFVVIFSVLCTPSAYFYFKYGSNNNNIKPELAAQEGKIDFLFCGASQFVWGFIPNVMDELYSVNSFNIASGLLSMEGRYTIIKDVVEKNPVKTLVLDLSYNSLERSDQTDTIEGSILLAERLDFADGMKYIVKNISLSDASAYIGYALRTGTYTLVSKLLNRSNGVTDPLAGKGYWGAHTATSMVGNVYWESGSYPEYRNYNTDDKTMEYLDKIMDYCESKNITVYFVTTPYPTRVISWADREGLLDVHKSIAKKYNCVLYDMNLYKDKNDLFFDETSYYDVEHLSTEGAITCTELLAELLANNDKGVMNSDKFYNSYYDLIDSYFAQNVSGVSAE